ncbi:oxygenase MpaB family protein [Marmoricola sp. RAF53]|uniref:oxygenase MpaB family protein n=1 Tax=Marmoricola sp. RAF53 TaxID=3233059 RepID=UPI003F96E173
MTTVENQPATSAARPYVPDVADAKFGLADYVGESALLLGAGSAVMNQLALYGVGKGVAEHSNTLDRPLDRLRTTLTYVYVMTLGTDEERRTVARLVNRAHRPVRGKDYTAFDPYLQLWVAATLAQNGEFIYEKTFGPMDEATRERSYQECRIFGTALQVGEDMWPATRADFTAYWERMQGELSPDPQVQAYAAALLSTRGAPLLLRPSIALQNLLTRGNLEPRVREVLALRWSRRDQRAYDAFWAFFRAVYPRVPRPLRTLHARLVMRGMRKRLRQNRRVI